MCLRGNKIFPVSLMNVAHENYFYGVKELSTLERKLIYEMTIKNAEGTQRKVREDWLNVYCSPFDYVDRLSSLGYSIWGQTERAEIREEPECKKWNIEYIEKLHGVIEDSGLKFIESLRKNDIRFWKDDVMRDQFSFFLANQYFRTKKTRNAILNSFEIAKAELNAFKDIRPENMWIPLSLIFASDVGVYIAQNFSAILFQTDSYFVVGDQPVINTHSTFDLKTQPKEVELFYPITPNSALLLTADPKYASGQTIKISADKTEAYNQLEQRSACEQVFAKEERQLMSFLSL